MFRRLTKTCQSSETWLACNAIALKLTDSRQMAQNVTRVIPRQKEIPLQYKNLHIFWRFINQLIKISNFIEIIVGHSKTINF